MELRRPIKFDLIGKQVISRLPSPISLSGTLRLRFRHVVTHCTRSHWCWFTGVDRRLCARITSRRDGDQRVRRFSIDLVGAIDADPGRVVSGSGERSFRRLCALR